MKTMKQLSILFFITITIVACNPDDGVNTDALPLAETLNNLFISSLNSRNQVAVFDASTTFTFTSSKGVKLIIDGTCLRKNGQPVTGIVKLEFLEIFDKGSMLSTNKATMGKTETDQNRLLVSGGEFYTNVTQDGVKLTTTCYINFKIPTSLTGGDDNAMLPFDGTIDADGNLTWEQAITSDLLVAFDQASGTSIYNAFSPSFGWFNCDRFMDYSGDKTTITAYVPEGYGSVSHVFLATKSIPNSLGKSFGEFPVGLECYLIFVTEKDGKFRYVIKPSTPLTPNYTITFTIEETTLGTPATLTTAINALP